jgi:iron complex transport system substrate-binding protein
MASLRFLLLISLAATLSAQPQRIVSTVPGLTEILFALGLGPQVAGVSEYCRYPQAALSKPKVGSFLQPNIETIAALKPTLVFIIKNPVRLKSRLEALQLRVEEVDLESLPAILASIERIGALTQRQSQATALRRDLERRLADLKSQIAKQPQHRVKAAFLVGRTPQRLEGMVAVGPKSYIEEVMRAAGADNIFSDSPAMYPKISIEQLLARDPDVLFEMGDAVHEGILQNKYRENVLAVWAKLPTLRAVKTNRVYPLNDDVFVVPGPRFVEAAERLHRMLQQP